MVRVSAALSHQMKTFGWHNRNKYFNHRKPLKYQRFQHGINPEQIVAQHSIDDYDKLDRHANVRNLKDAQTNMTRGDYLLPNLRPQDLEVSELFQKEKDRQRAMIARIEKIRVIVDSVPGKDTELMMNQHISTPFDCARHIHNLVTNQAVVAQISDLDIEPVRSQIYKTYVKTIESDSGDSQQQKLPKDPQNPPNVAQNLPSDSQSQTLHAETPRPIYWDMHRPLESSCRIRFRHFAENDVNEVNKIYWRSCSFVLGMAVRLAFKDDIKVLLHSWPRPNIRSGSFVYDLALNLGSSWEPNEKELMAFTKIMWEIKEASLPFERLEMDSETAKKLFPQNPFKLSQIDSIADAGQGKVTIYRCGGLTDVSVGPMISNTNQIGRISLAAVHPFDSQSEQHKGIFYRFQGVSLPHQLPLSSYLYQNVLLSNAKKLNRASL